MAVGFGEFLSGRCRRPDCPTAFPALSRPAPFPFAGVGDGKCPPRPAGPLKERGSGPKLAFLHVRGPRTQLCSRRNVSGGPRLPGASLRSFPSPLSREPDLASAIFPSSSLRFCFQHFRFTSLVFFFHLCVAVLSDFPFFGDVFIPFRGGFSVLSLGLKCPAHLAKGFLPSPRRNGAIAF